MNHANGLTDRAPEAAPMPAPAAFLPHPSRLFVEVTSRCNLRCRMCVKHSGQTIEPEGDMTSATYAALRPAMSHLDALILTGVGEPLLHDGLEGYIREARAVMPESGWIGFQTNGQLMTDRRAETLLDAGLGRVCLSIDAVSPELFEACRAGGDVRRVDRALSALTGARTRRPGSRLEIGVEFVLMRENLRELPATLRWAASRGVDYAVVSHILPYNKDMAGETVFGANTEASRVFYREWKKRAEREGVTISRYFDICFHCPRNDEERKIASFITAMSNAAREADIPFHLKNLLFEADSMAEEAQAVFEEAKAVSLETGLRLKLPALIPRNLRRCPSVEDGGAFVTWDGRVAPCYFLWRGYSCHLYGHLKQVTPKFFGRLDQSTDILDIWNADDYAAFRADVAVHGYPFCTNCNVYPCSDIGVDFEYDCYGNPVPCGDCLWCMGLLQCMGQEQDDWQP